MGKKQKAKTAKAAEQACDTITVPSQPGKRAEKKVGRGGGVPSTEAPDTAATLLPIPSCQALVDRECRAKCGGTSTSPDGKWCEYHDKMRMDLYQSFHELLQKYQSTSDTVPNMALMREAVDLDWVERYWEPLHTRIEVLEKALLCRNCFMDRLQGNDLDFKTKKYIKGLREARARLESNLRVVEERMFMLIGFDSEDERSINTISSQLFCHMNQQQQRCIHHDEIPDTSFPTFIFPIDRQYRHQLMENFQGSVVDAHNAAELRRFRIELLEKLGVRLVRPTEYEPNNHHKLIVHWDSIEERRRAHIATAYYRRICFVESHLFVQAHHHMRALENDRLPHIIIENPRGDQLDFDEDMDPALLCMVTFLLSQHLKLSHLTILRDSLWWPAWDVVRTAIQDVYIDEDTWANEKPQAKPWWRKPRTRAPYEALDDEYNDPQGAYILLCGTLYEASYPQAHRDDVITPEYWPHFGSLIRCGKCLFSMAWSSDEWFAIVRAFAMRRTPMYSRIFPQVVGDGVGRLWASDSITDIVRGQSDPCYDNLGLTYHEHEQKCENGQARLGPDSGGRYRLDETLEIAGVVMLGIVTGGPVVRPDIVDNNRRQFLETFKLYPQIWFLLTSDPNPRHKDFVLGLVHRLALRANQRGSDLMISGVAIEHPEIEADLLNVPSFHNASRRRLGTSPWWEPMNTGFDSLRNVAGLKYDPVPRRLMGDCPVIHLACRPANPDGVRWLLDVLLEAAIEASSVSNRTELEESWIESQTGWTGRGDNHEGVLSYRFGPWCDDEDMTKKDVSTQTPGDGFTLEHEDRSPNTLISGLQELHAGTMETVRLEQTPPHGCRSPTPTFEATGHYSPSRETLTINCSMPVGLFEPSISQAYELHSSSPLSGDETNTATQSLNTESLDEYDERPSGRERDILSTFAPPNKDREGTHIDWFDLVMSEDGNQLPDLSDWREVRTGQYLVLRQTAELLVPVTMDVGNKQS